MYFISNIYQSVKGLVALTGLTGSLLAIIYGTLQSGGTIFIIGGSLCMANSLFNIIEISKVNLDIRKQIKNLESSIATFIDQNNQLGGHIKLDKINIERQAVENSKLRGIVIKSGQQVQKLEELQIKILSAKNAIKDEARKLKDENQILVTTLEQYKSLRDEYSVENQKLKTTISELEQQVSALSQVKENIAFENQQLHVNNENLEKQITRQAAIIVESKKLIQSLAQFGDSYTAFGDSLGKDIDRLEGTASGLDGTLTVLHNLVEKLKTQSFSNLDLNNDGIVTFDEFADGVKYL